MGPNLKYLIHLQVSLNLKAFIVNSLYKADFLVSSLKYANTLFCPVKFRK